MDVKKPMMVSQLHNLICLHTRNLTCNKAFISIGCKEADTKLGSITADLTLGMRHKQQLPFLKSAIRVYRFCNCPLQSTAPEQSSMDDVDYVNPINWNIEFKIINPDSSHQSEFCI